MATFGIPWPHSIHQVLDYLNELAERPCAYSKPENVVSALASLEKCGAVGPQDRLSTQTLLLRFLDNIKMELATSRGLTRKAGLFTLSIVVALEFYVMDRTVPRYKRCLAWIRLVKLWTSARFDDF